MTASSATVNPTKDSNDTAGVTSHSYPDEFAVVWSAREGFTLRVPKLDDDAIIPDGGMVIIAAGSRLATDPEFQQQCYDWFLSIFQSAPAVKPDPLEER